MRVTNKGFEPKSIEIESGNTVVFENADEEGHWPASDDHPTHTKYSEFDPRKSIESGAEWSFTFDKPGEWKYHDHQNPYLKGEVVVAPGASDGGDGDDSKAGGFFAFIGSLFSNAYGAVLSALVLEGEEPASADAEETSASGVDSGELSGEQFAEARDRYMALASDEDPKAALDILRDETETDDALSRSCHAIVHEIGHAAYMKYGDFSEAMKYQDEICNSGYIHGVIESRFAESDDVFTDMKTLCNEYPLGSFLRWQCYHGLGHGVMYYTANDLPRSLETCDAFRSSFGRSSCVNGVFMENFNTDQKLHLSEYLRDSDPFYPCTEQTDRHKGDCYLYAPTYFLSLDKGGYADALEWCNDAEEPFQASCARGVGSQTMKENIKSPNLVESICMSGEPGQVEPCIEGMMGLYINHYGSIEPAQTLCGQLEASNQQTCYAWVGANARLFNS